MPHRIEVDGRTRYTWCGIDSLFIPEMLGQSVKAESRDPHTGAVVTLDEAFALGKQLNATQFG